MDLLRLFLCSSFLHVSLILIKYVPSNPNFFPFPFCLSLRFPPLVGGRTHTHSMFFQPFEDENLYPTIVHRLDDERVMMMTRPQRIVLLLSTATRGPSSFF